MMIATGKACPRCGGRMVTEPELYAGVRRFCLACGHEPAVVPLPWWTGAALAEDWASPEDADGLGNT